MDIYDVVKKLVGNINPVGETNTDNQRFDNLQVMVDLLDKLLVDVGDVARFNLKRHEYSRERAGKLAHRFLKMNGIDDY